MNNELFKLYLEEVNKIEEDNTKRRVKAPKKVIKYIDLIIIMVLGLSLGIITLWNVALEILTKIR